MTKKSLLVALLAVLGLGQVSDAQFQALQTTRPTGLKGNSLDFANVTSTRIMPTVAEQSNNEKEVEFGDFDNDGDPDVVIAVALSDFTERRNKLYRNDNGVYNEVSGTSVMPYFSLGEVTRSAFFRDYDDDGWLDLITVSDSNNGVTGRTRYYRNNHPGGVFTNFVEESGRLNGAGGAACIALSFDVDHDGDDDLYLGNYPFNSQDTLYLNDGTGNFVNVTSSNMPTEQDYTVDAAAADFNGDGKVDMIVTSSFNDPTFFVYNDLNGNGSGVGDYKYSGSRENIGTTFEENAAEPGDFNNDGMIDVYYSNRVGNTDRLMMNTGNGADGKANWTEINMTGLVSSSSSRKSTVVDLDKDGRLDVIVMGQSRRPVIFRNTSVGGQVSFVEWTPADVFPNGSSLAGWHSAAFDATANGRPDIFLGGNSGDHLFENRPSATTKEAATNGMVPAIHNASPIAIFGNGVGGEVDVYSTANIPSGATVSVVLKSSVDLKLEAKTSGGTVIASSDRGGTAVEEAFQYTATPNGSLVVTFQGGSTAIRPYMLEILSRN